MKRGYLLLCLLLTVILTSCSYMPLDEIEIYEAGLRFKAKGEYRIAAKILEEYVEKDSLYTPLHLSLIDTYYQLQDFERLEFSIARANRLVDDDLLKNISLAFSALKSQSWEREEYISFYQFIEDIGNKHGFDPALILALIHQQSDFKVDYQNYSIDQAGIMGLTVEQAELLGLEVATDSDLLASVQLQKSVDERYNPAKSITRTADYLAQLIDKNRFGSKNSDLIQSLYDFYSLEKEEETEQLAEPVASVVKYFQHYRRDFDNQEVALKRFYEENESIESCFSSQKTIDMKSANELQIEPLNLESLPETIDDDTYKTYYYNNLALVYEHLGQFDNAESYYQKALEIFPDEKTVLFNAALFYFDQQDYEKTLSLLDKLEDQNDLEIIQMRGYAYLLLENYNSYVQMFQKLDEKALTDPLVQNLQGVYLFVTGDMDGALKYFRKAAENQRYSIASSNYLAAIYSVYYPGKSVARLSLYNKMSRTSETGLRWPNDLRYISSNFGWRPNPFQKVWIDRLSCLDFHNGLDLPGRVGIEVYAAASGRVTVSENFPLGGESIFILHLDGFTSTYLHLHERFVEVGEEVEQGQLIGLVGNTGASTGAHLHFGLFDENWQPVNPLIYLPSN